MQKTIIETSKKKIIIELLGRKIGIHGSMRIWMNEWILRREGKSPYSKITNNKCEESGGVGKSPLS